MHQRHAMLSENIDFFLMVCYVAEDP